MLLEYHSECAVLTEQKLVMMLIYHEREVSEQQHDALYLFSAQMFLKYSNMIWKMARASRQ